MKERPDIPNYKDFLFRGIACLLAAHMIVMMGSPKLTTFQALLKPLYYPTVLLNYGIALIVGMAVKKVTVALDKRYPWYMDIWRRALLQFTFGVLAVSILSYLLVLIYFISIGQDMVESGYLHYELPFSVSLITILNFYYVAYYFYMYPRQSSTIHQPPQLFSETLEREDEFRELEPQLNGAVITNEGNINAMNNQVFPDPIVAVRESMATKNREVLIIDSHTRSIPIKVADVVMFFIIDSTVFVRLKGMKSLNDCLQFDMYLNDIMDMIGDQSFFRLNRKCIVNFEAIGSFTQLSERKILIALKAEYTEFGNIDAEVWNRLFEVFGSKVAEFKTWINR